MMKTTLKILVLLTLAAMAVGAQTKGFSSRYDKFKEQTFVTSDDHRISSSNKSSIGLKVKGLFSYSGEIKRDTNFFFLQFEPISRCRVWCFSRSHKLLILADGKPFPFTGSAGNWNGSIATSRETVHYVFTRSEFEELIKAKTVEIQLGSFEGILKDDHLRMLQTLHSLGSK